MRANFLREKRRNVRQKHAIFDRLELELSVCFHLVAAISNRSGTD